jgi:pantoate--beta-alanine ligase
VREHDGLAMSSRNAYLSAEERAAATVLSRALAAVAEAARPGRSTRDLEAVVRDAMAAEPLVDLEYAEARDARTLETADVVEGRVVLAVAARVGRARLIDNVVLTVNEDKVEADLGVRDSNGELVPCSAS